LSDDNSSHRKTIANPLTGESIAFEATSATTDGQVLSFLWTVPSHFAGPAHVHLEMTEVLEVRSGAMTVRMNGRDHRLPAGSGLVIPPGTPHRGWTTSNGTTDIWVELRPAGQEEHLLRDLFELAAGGYRDRVALDDLLERHRKDTLPVPNVACDH